MQDPASGRPIGSGVTEAGQLFGAVKSDHLPVPSLLTAGAAVAPPDWTTPPTPMLERILVPASERDETKLSETLAKLAETDRGLKVMQEEGTGAQLVCAQGPVHLREVCRTLSDVFHVEVSDRPRARSTGRPFRNPRTFITAIASRPAGQGNSRM